jgi:5-(carboxyamino)imidazole ribonucleotide mutase
MRVAVIMGSQSDWPVMRDAVTILEEMQIPCDVHVLSAHRTPDRMAEFARNAEDQGYAAIIAGAGGAAHLPGMTAAYTTVPVIGVPIASKSVGGLDSLLSIVQMPGGIPVATVAIGQARNAGILAAEIIGISEPAVRARLRDYRGQLRDEVIASEAALESPERGAP